MGSTHKANSGQLLSRYAPGIMPRMANDESLEVTKIYSVSGMLPPETRLMVQRPFRSPHHTISHAGLVGGGRWPRPDEITLAHRGVVFLDVLPEFGQHVFGERAPAARGRAIPKFEGLLQLMAKSD